MNSQGMLLATYQVALLIGIFSVLVQVILYVYRAKKSYGTFLRQHGCQPPPVLANQRPFGVDRLEQIFRADKESRLMELFLFHFRQTGSTLKQKFLMTPAYGTIDPLNLEAILSSKIEDWSIQPRCEITAPLLGSGIFTQEGPMWKLSRQQLRPQFHYKQYENLTVFDQAIDNLLQAIARSQTDKGVTDLQPHFFNFTLDTTTAFLFGKDIQSLKASYMTEHGGVGVALDTAQGYIARRFRLGPLFWLIGGKRFRDACRIVHRFAADVIDMNAGSHGEAGVEDNYVFLNSIAKIIGDKTELRGQIMNTLVAGRDTTACLLSWTFFLLIRYPYALEKLKDEIKALKYLHYILKETLRLYPPVPVNTRTSTRDTVLPTGGGPDRQSPIFVPGGTSVAFSVYSLHRRPDLFGMDAEIFRPERWDENLPIYSDPKLRSWGYLPFHGGPRACLGADFAMTQAAYTVVRILDQFPNLSLPPDAKVEPTGAEKQTVTLVLSITEGCHVDLNS